MRRIIDRFKWLQLLLGLVLVALGVLTIVITANVGQDDYQLTIFIVWASVLGIIAVTLIVFDIVAFHDKAEFTSLIAAGVCIGLGIYILINRADISRIVTTLMPYILISIGGTLLLKTIILAVRRVNFKSWLSPFVIAVACITAGVIFLVVKDLEKIIYYVLGTFFIILGAIEIIGYVTIIANKHAENKLEKPRKEKKKKVKGERVEQDVYYSNVEEDDDAPEIVEANPKQIGHEDDIKLIK